MDLEALAVQIVEYTSTLVEAAEQQRSVAALQELPNTLCRYYRSLGILALLNTGDPDPFFHGLIQSGVTRRWYLERCAAEGHLDAPPRRASFIDPFVDAVAADQLSLAADVARLSPADWMPGYEYEDDFAYARCLFALAAPDDAAAAPLAAAVDRYEAALEGAADDRLAVVKALGGRDQPAFDDTFATLLSTRERTLSDIADPERDSILAQDYNFEPNRRIFVEGLALLRIAALRGLTTAAEYPRCPRIVRRYDYAPFKPFSFPLVPLR